jgi:uncharacterized heparinase superfamily protein
MAERDGIAEMGRGAWRRLRRSIASDLQDTPIYQLALRSRPPAALAGRLVDLRPGSVEKGLRLLDGVFAHGGERLTVGPQGDVGGDVWAEAAPSDRFYAWLHGFSWLRDLIAADPDAGAARARRLLDGWLARFGKWDKTAWSAAPTACRTLSWLTAASVLFPDEDPGAGARLDALARHAKHLEHLATLPLEGADAFAVAIALAAVGACLPKGERQLGAGLQRCAAEAARQILPDGGHVSRSPETGVELLADLAALEDAVAMRGFETPEAIGRGIDRLAAMLRFFLAADDGLVSFHGGGEGDRGLIAALLASDEDGGRPFELAPHSGYHRVAAGGNVLIFDIGGPPPGAFSIEAHASCLAFELSTPGGRLIVNCGWAGDQPQRFRDPVRATAAHSTLTAADTSSMRILGPGLKRELLGARPVSGPGQVAARRNEEARGVWIDGSHEGYRQVFGLIHRRRIYVSEAGEDIRGEDSLSRAVEDAGRTEPAATLYAIRFHLAPGVAPELARDRRSAILTQPSGEVWRFRTDVGPIEVEPSIYLAAGGGPRATSQLVLRGAAKLAGAIDRPPNCTRWALQRLGHAPAA